MTAKLKRGITKVKDPGSALTHFIAMILAIIAAIPLLSKAGHDSGHMHISALAIFILSMIGLYAASTIYHTLDISPKINKLLRKIDHMMIFILIAGTYTPVCMIVLGDKTGWTMLTLVWGIAIVGILINALWITCPKWFSSLIYIAMGWVCILAITKNIELHAQGRLHVASGRRYHLYSGRHYLCHETSVLQLPPQVFWFP